MLLKVILLFLSFMCVVHCTEKSEDNNFLENFGDTLMNSNSISGGDEKDDVDDLKQKKDSPPDVNKEALNTTLSNIKNFVKDVGDKWEKFVKHLHCSHGSSKFIKCTVDKVDNEKNPDTWKANVSHVPFPDSDPESNQIPTKINESLFDWLKHYHEVIEDKEDKSENCTKT